MRFKLVLLFLCLTCSLFARPGFHAPWGKDADLEMLEKKEEEKQTYPFFVKAFEKVYLFHQNIISPVDGPRSHFRPTSSRYMLLAMRKYGFLKGYVAGCDRLLRENGEEWLYRTKEINGKIYQWDPP